MSGRTSAFQLARRRAIRHAASELIQSRGVDVMSIKDIAAGARMSVGCLYRYYPGKNMIILDVFRSALDEVRDTVVELKRGPIRSPADFGQEMIRATALHLERYGLDLQKMVVLAFIEASRNDGLRRDAETFYIAFWLTFIEVGKAFYSDRMGEAAIMQEAEQCLLLVLGAFTGCTLVKPAEFRVVYERVMKRSKASTAEPDAG